jgi:hypothetical protein
MKKQTKQMLVLFGLLLTWAAIAWRLKMIGQTAATAEIKARAAKAAQQDNPLTARFHRVRGEMDALYHYRIKPQPYDTGANPFRLPAGMAIFEGPKQASAETPGPNSKTPAPAPGPAAPPDFGETLLKHAIAAANIGGVVTMNDVSQVSVNGQLHREGDVFAVKLQTRLILIRIKRLTVTFVTLALEDPENGVAEQRVRLQ